MHDSFRAAAAECGFSMYDGGKKKKKKLDRHDKPSEARRL
jgi:hypothetical protein